MGKTAIVYYSQHHGNTKKVLDAIANYDKDIDLIDVIEKHEVGDAEHDMYIGEVVDIIKRL